MNSQANTPGTNKLGLGTVQFGLDYGVSNSGGKTQPEEVCKILEVASLAGIRIIDTAFMYGDSEEVLGAVWPRGHHFQVVTKTPRLIDSKSVDLLAQTLFQSLDRLKLDAVYGLLIHNSDDLLTPYGQAIIRTMVRLREQGLIQKTGVSVYSARQIDSLLEMFTPDIIQLPFNVLDQRLLVSGHLAKLKQRGIEIHVRSVFLQGLLLMNPTMLHPYFAPLKRHLLDYNRFIDGCGMSPLQAALGFVTGIDDIDTVICGVDTLSQFEEIRAAVGCFVNADFGQFAVHDEEMINPSHWKLA